MDTKISVVIPTYNRAFQVCRAIESVLNQKIVPFEIIVVDDGSTDKTKETLFKYYNNKIKYYFQENAGVSAARNTGINKSKGNWIAFLDSDDEWMNKHLTNYLNIVNNNPQCDFLHCNRVHQFPDGSRDLGRSNRKLEIYEDKAQLLSGWSIKTSTVMIKKSVISDNQLYFNQEINTCEDYEFFWKVVILSIGIKYSSESTVLVNLGHDSLSRSAVEFDLLNDNLKAVKNVIFWSRKHKIDNALVSILVKRFIIGGIYFIKLVSLNRNLLKVLKNYWSYRQVPALTFLMFIYQLKNKKNFYKARR